MKSSKYFHESRPQSWRLAQDYGSISVDEANDKYQGSCYHLKAFSVAAPWLAAAAAAGDQPAAPWPDVPWLGERRASVAQPLPPALSIISPLLILAELAPLALPCLPFRSLLSLQPLSLG